MLPKSVICRLARMMSCLVVLSVMGSALYVTSAQAAPTDTIPWNGSHGDETYASVLGNARYFGITANRWAMEESETNAAVKTLDGDQQSGTDMTNSWVK